MADEIRRDNPNATDREAGRESREAEPREAQPRDLGSRREFEASDVARANEAAERPEPIGDRGERQEQNSGMFGRMRDAWARIRGRE